MGSMAVLIKSLLRPLAKQRFLLERMKYAGQKVLEAHAGNDLIAARLDRPGAAGKIGGTEMKLINRYFHRRDSTGYCADFGKWGRLAPIASGIYPNDGATLSRFCRAYLETVREVDLLAVWYNFGEARVRREYAPHAEIFQLTGLEPFLNERPWSRNLAGKRVVVVTPFEKSVLAQYARREKIWPAAPEMLPEFRLRVVRCQQSAGIIDKLEYPDWFAGLEDLKRQLGLEPFDVAIIGAGAWSLPLAVHAKSLGAFGIHLGGATQLLFGIMGSRWKANPNFSRFINDAWTMPSADERPTKATLQENACYW
jgi:hypothetical protein